MQREPVSSTSIRSIGYDEIRQILEVEFQKGRIYRYYGVPGAIYGEFKKAQSKGRYMNAHIRTCFTYDRVL